MISLIQYKLCTIDASTVRAALCCQGCSSSDYKKLLRRAYLYTAHQQQQYVSVAHLASN
jgi:hypothetical protein